MTRRDYVLLTEVCARHTLPHKFIVDLCNALYEQNGRFDTERFLVELDKKKGADNAKKDEQ